VSFESLSFEEDIEMVNLRESDLVGAMYFDGDSLTV